MLCGESTILETHYDILSVREDASYEEIRASYRAALLNYHPDKFQKTPEVSDLGNESGNRFLRVRKAWEVLGNPRSRAIYDSELRSSKQDTVVADDISLEDMIVEDDGTIVELFYQCQCSDYNSIDSLELGKMGYALLRNGDEISLQTSNTSPASVILPCGSCSLHVRLLIDSDMKVPVAKHL